MAKRVEVVGAVIVRDGKILCARRGESATLAGLWEFPGGKIEPNEHSRDALVREILEEFQCEVTVGEELTTTVHEYDFATIVLTTYWCVLVAGVPRPTEHADFRWLLPSELGILGWAPADVPAVERIRAIGVPLVS